MLASNVCKQCKLGNVLDPQYDRNGNKVSNWGVECRESEKNDDYKHLLLMYHDPPKWCPYALEHQLAMQNVPVEEILEMYNMTFEEYEKDRKYYL